MWAQTISGTVASLWMLPLVMASPWTNLPAGAASDIKQYQVSFPKAEVERMYTLMNASVVGPKTFFNTDNGTDWGISYETLTETRDYFLHRYSWAEAEKKINRHPHFITKVDGDSSNKFDISFMGLFSHRRDAIPIAFFHGWPGSFFEFMGLLDVVKSKWTPETSPYHFIVPSLPGYPLSPAPLLKHIIALDEVTNVMDRLMVKIGFADGYIAQGGDVGSFVTQALAQTSPHVKGAHVNFLLPIKPPNFPPPDSDPEITDLERREFQEYRDWIDTSIGYIVEQRTRGATLGFALQSNPLALLAWIGEKLNAWVDQAKPLPLDEKLTEIALYWLTGTTGASFWPYVAFHPENPGPFPAFIKIPFGYSKFKSEIFKTPKKWLAQVGNVTYFNSHDNGGHFAAWEQPEELWSDVEAFVGKSFPHGLGK